MFVYKKECVGMKSKKAIFWLKASFLVGMITDALALIPMLYPPMAGFFWGFKDFTGIYYFAMGYGAALMLAWTILLYWAYRKPLERRYIALFTILILVCFVITEIVSVFNGYIQLGKIIPSLVLQAIWLVLFNYSFIISGNPDKSPVVAPFQPDKNGV
jgi:hypothetical protein